MPAFCIEMTRVVDEILLGSFSVILEAGQIDSPARTFAY